MVAALPALADQTNVHEPYYGNELNHEEILEAIYGADFAASGKDYYAVGDSGGLNVVRFDDYTDLGDILHVVDATAGSAGDEVWGYGDILATARARYAGYSQQFAIDRGAGVEVLFDVSGHGTSVSGSATLDLSGDTWSWVRRDTDGTNAYYSQQSLNGDGLDHMVTYQIQGMDTDETVWLLFWEDLPGDYGPPGGSDRDFNDLVVEIRSVPEPASLALIAIGLPLIMRRRVKGR